MRYYYEDNCRSIAINSQFYISKILGDNVAQTENQISELIKEIQALEDMTDKEPTLSLIELCDVKQNPKGMITTINLYGTLKVPQT